ncbi:ubiquinone biosynthesis accessory factor UbiJ [Shewanella chilikensis]|uniref:ubiquinone biosynthesis accessory factor UbiJ n=1 Tax=Shewanella chilikensis TaxID=558541 RepID=UPI003B679A4E
MNELSLTSQWRLLCCAALEMALEKVTNQAESEYVRLKSLHGKVLCLQLSQLNWPLYLVFAKKIQVLSNYEGEVAVTVKADATTLYRLGEGESLTELIKQDKLVIEGELSLLQTFSHFLQQVRFDFAEPLSRYLGDAPAHILLSGLERARADLSRVFNKTQSHLAQLTTEEYKLAPHRLEFIHHCDKIDELATATDALEQRLANLKDKKSP